MEQPPHGISTHGMPELGHLCRNALGRLAAPPQQAHRIAPRIFVHDTVQVQPQYWIQHLQARATPTRAAQPLRNPQALGVPQLPYPFSDCWARDTTQLMDFLNAAMSQL